MGERTVKKSENVDRGLAYALMASSFMLRVLLNGMAWSTSYNVVFVCEFEESKSVMTWTISLTAAMMYGIGLVPSILINTYGCRLDIIIGGIISFLGLFSIYISPNLYVLFFTLGIVTGAAYGLVFIPSITVISLYFDKRRTLVVGIAASSVGAGNFLYPAMVQWLNDLYNWPASIFVLSVINLYVIACGALIRQVTTFDHNDDKSKVLDITPFKKKGYWMLSLNNFLFCCGISAFYMLVSTYAEDIHTESDRSALLFSGMGVANILGWILYGLVGIHPRVNNMALYTVSLALAGVTISVIPYLTSYTGLMIVVVVVGLFNGCFGTLLVPIVLEILGLHHLANGYGYLLLFEATGHIIGGPIVGKMSFLLITPCRMLDVAVILISFCMSVRT